MTLHRIALTASENTASLKAVSAAWLGDNDNRYAPPLLLLSATGPRTSVNGAAAMLRSKTPCQITLDGGVGLRRNDPFGYHCWSVLLAADTWHLLAVSKDPSLLPANNDDHLWRLIRSDQITTPVLQGWVPSIREQLVESKIIRPLNGFNHNAAVCHLQDKALDRLVSEGVKNKTLRIPRRTA
jgi:hypothetical protein